MTTQQPGLAAPGGRHAGSAAHTPIFERLEVRLCLAAGGLDPSFGGDGIVLTKFAGPNDDYATAVAIQEDGKAVVAGRTVENSGGSGPQFLLMRFNTDGTLDKTFGSGGVVHTNYDFSDQTGGFGAYISDVAIQENGKIIVSGSFGPDFAAARFNADGSIDKKFGDAGIFRTQLHTFGSSFAVAVAVRSDGRILLGGQARVGEGAESNLDSTLVQLTRTGALDESFGDGGIVSYDLGVGSDDRIYDLTLDGDGKIVVVGEVGWNEEAQGVVARFNADGSIDMPFGFDGKTHLGVHGVADSANSVLVLGGGRIVTVGRSDGDVAIRAFKTDGHEDTDFGNEGRIIKDLGSAFDAGTDVISAGEDAFFVLASKGGAIYPGADFAVLKYSNDGEADASFGDDGVAGGLVERPAHFMGVALTEDGSLVLAGNEPFDYATEEDVIVARLTESGALDTAFSGDGVTTAGVIGRRHATVVEVESLGEGKVLALGRVSQVNGGGYVLTQYNADGSFDKRFGRRGRVTLPNLVMDHNAAVSIEPDGQIVVAGIARGDGGEDLNVIRLNADGSRDKSFGEGGVADTTELYIYPTDVEIQADGKIVVGGSYNIGLFSSFGLARFNADGSLDTSFGQGGGTSINFTHDIEHIEDVVVQPDGKLVAVGTTVQFTMLGGVNPAFAAVARLNGDGTLDESFSEDGKLEWSGVEGGEVGGGAVGAHVNKRGRISFVTGTGYLVRVSKAGVPREGAVQLELGEELKSVAFDGRGSFTVLTYGHDELGEPVDSVITRFTKAGQREKLFGEGGSVEAPFGATSIALDVEEDRLLLGGTRNGRFAVARYLLD